jgi:NAD+-dependent secondary alcohol dehydrogenase Adh1
MKAQVLKQYDDDLTASSWVDLENVPDPKIEKASDVIVRIGGAGVCRTDLHIIEGVWREATDADRKLLPLIMGHENAGWIEDVGSEVEGLKKGDPVIVHPKITGGTCLACRRGHDMHGENGSFPGVDCDGGYAEALKTSCAQHRETAADFDSKGSGGLCRCGPYSLSRSEESIASPVAG